MRNCQLFMFVGSTKSHIDQPLDLLIVSLKLSKAIDYIHLSYHMTSNAMRNRHIIAYITITPKIL